MCMNCKGSGASKGSSYTPKAKSTTRTTSSQQTKVMKGWAGSSGGGFGTPKIGRVSFGKR